MRFRVPQFLGIEDKIFGPLSFKQFVYLAGGGGAVVVIWYFVDTLFLTALFGLPIIAFSVALAFFEVNKKPFIFIVEAFFKYIIANRMYIWQKREPKTVKEQGFETLPTPKAPHATFEIQRMTNSKLKDLEWSVDVAGAGVSADDHPEVTDERKS